MQHPGSSSGIAADAMALSMLPKARAEIALIQEIDKSFYRIFHMITHRNVVLEKIQAHE